MILRIPPFQEEQAVWLCLACDEIASSCLDHPLSTYVELKPSDVGPATTVGTSMMRWLIERAEETTCHCSWQIGFLDSILHLRPTESLITLRQETRECVPCSSGCTKIMQMRRPPTSIDNDARLSGLARRSDRVEV